MKDVPMSMSKSEKERIERSLLENPLLQTLSDYKDPNTRRRRQDDATRQDTFDSKIHDVNADLLTKASMTLPMRWDGNSLTLQKNIRTSISCGIPASVNNGRWSGTVSGSSIVRGPMGCASGAINLTYHPSILKGSKLSGGLQVGDQTHLNIGGFLRRGHSSLAINVVSKRRDTFSLATTLSAQRKFEPCRINGRVTLGSSSSPNWNVSVSPSLVPHMQLGVGWNRSQQPSLHLMLCPKISPHRRGNITIHWRPAGGWNVGAVLTQSLASKVASLGVGIRLCRKQLEWIFMWNRGDVSVRVPIIITQYQNVWMNCLQVAYLSVVSLVIQDVIADLWNLSSPQENEALRKEHERMKRAKARSDAEQQKQLMLKQAQNRARLEQAKHGLVIRQAVYQVPGGDSWDVTAQLQFWTENSSLELPSTSKKDLLGFYNVAASVESNNNGGETWLSQLCGKPKEESTTPTPHLSVQYYYAKRLYEITVNDDERLKLPSSKAVPRAE